MKTSDFFSLNSLIVMLPSTRDCNTEPFLRYQYFRIEKSQSWAFTKLFLVDFGESMVLICDLYVIFNIYLINYHSNHCILVLLPVLYKQILSIYKLF